jgi:hypothetical protein
MRRMVSPLALISLSCTSEKFILFANQAWVKCKGTMFGSLCSSDSVAMMNRTMLFIPIASYVLNICNSVFMFWMKKIHNSARDEHYLIGKKLKNFGPEDEESTGVSTSAEPAS